MAPHRLAGKRAFVTGGMSGIGASIRDRFREEGASVSVADLVENYFYKHHFRMFPVVSGERLTGCVSTAEVMQLAREEWESRGFGTRRLDLDGEIARRSGPKR